MKDSVKLGLAALSCAEFRYKHGHRPGLMRYDVMAEACGCSPQAMRQFCERTLAKVERKLLARGVDRATAIMALQVLGQGDSYHCNLDENSDAPFVS